MPLGLDVPGASGQPIIDKEIAFLFEEKRDCFPNKPYYEDGNPEFYSEENVKKREELKNDPTVRDAIDSFITSQFRGLSSEDSIVSKSDYVTQFLKIAMILRSGPNSDPESISALVQAEYEKDTNRGNEEVTKAKLYDSLYELADIWCPNIDADEIAHFFEYMIFRFRYEGQKNTNAYELMDT